VLDLAEIPLKPILVVTATGECIKPAAVAERLCEVKVAQTRAEEANRLARVAVVNATYAAAVAAGAHPTKPRHKGPSLVHNAVKAATEQDIVKPSTFNHNSVRVPHRAMKTWDKCRAGQQPQRNRLGAFQRCRLCNEVVCTYAHARGCLQTRWDQTHADGWA